MAANSILFDEQYYLQQNGDVAIAISKGQFASGQAHFNAFGRFENRDPNAFFDTSFYLSQYPDVARSGLNPFDHFLQFGAKEGRFFNANELASVDTNNDGISNEFNEAVYRSNNPDVDQAIKNGAFANAYQHFVLFGQFEGRAAPLTNGTTVSGPLANGGTGGGTNTGTTFTLTANVDGPGAASPAVNTNGTNGNDTYNATEATLTSADNINAGAGTDTLSLRATAVNTVATAQAPVLNSVENVVVSNLTAGLFAFNAVSATGTTAYTVKDSTAASTTTLLNVAAAASLNLDNADGAVRFNVSGDRTGTTDAFTLNVGNGSGTATNAADVGFVASNGVTGDATFEVANINTSGAASFVSFGGSGANISTINVAGSGALTLSQTAGFANVKTVDASKMTGTAGLDVNLSGNTQNVTVTGSGANDTFRLGASLTTADVVNGGAGRDAIGITDGATLTAGLQVTNFEVLDIAGATASTFNASRIAGIDTLRVSTATAGAVSVTDLAKTATVEIQAALGGTLSLTQAGAGAGSPSDTITVNLGGAAAVSTGNGLVITDIETVNLNSVTTATGSITNTLSSLTDTVATTVNLNASTAALTVTDLTTLAAVRIDASSSLKAVSITTSTDAFTSTGGTAIILGQAADTLDLTGATSSNVTAGNTLASADFVITGGKGGDLITLSAASVNNEVITINAGDSVSGVDTSGARQFDTITNFDAVTAGGGVADQDLIDVRSFAFTGTERVVNTVTPATAVTSNGTIAAADATNFFGTGAARAGVAVVYAADVDPTTGGAQIGAFVYIDANKDGQLNAGDQTVALAGLTADVNTADFLFA